MHFYMIRKIGTDTYYHSFLDYWSYLEQGLTWWHDQGLKDAYKTFERLRKLGIQCAIVKFKVEEMKHVG